MSLSTARLSALSFMCHFMVYDTEYFCNALYLEDFSLGCYCLADTITHQNLFSKGSHKSKSTGQWTCKTNQTGEQDMQINDDNDSSPLFVFTGARYCSEQDI